MAKKKKGKKKGKKEAKGPADGEPLTPEQEIAFLKKENEALKKLLEAREEYATKKEVSEENLRKNVQELEKAFEKKFVEDRDIKHDMTRQYKAMEKQFEEKLETLRQEKQKVEENLQNSVEEKNEQREHWQKLVLQKEKEINEAQIKMEDLCQDFANMLKKTLDKLTQKLETKGNEEMSPLGIEFAETLATSVKSFDKGLKKQLYG
eukprot:snap_masked-scaffold_94-processed-gene-0.21-mRNA-1 protein AED:0.76 eAED:1.00 QI:0/-1/0/1/-1/1/1/0/205